MKKIVMWLFLILALISFGCLTNNKTGQGGPVLKFNNNGEFKIAQFTDLHSGGTNTYGDLTRGARIIILSEGKRQFRTWLHLVNGEIVDDVIFPDDFLQDEEPLVD